MIVLGLVVPESAVQVWDALFSAGQPQGLRVCGYRVLDSLRIEKGYRYYGTDLTSADTPFEAALGFCVAMDKGEFIGREALAGLAGNAPARRIRTLLVGDPDEPPVQAAGDYQLTRAMDLIRGISLYNNRAN